MADLSQVPTDQLLQMLNGGNGGGAATPVQAPPPQTPAQAAFDAGRRDAANESGLQAGISQAAQQGTASLQNYINAGASSLAQGKGLDVTNPENLAYSRGKSQGEAESHPTAATIGGIAGAVLGPGKYLSGIEGLVRHGLASAGAAVTQSLAQGQSIPQAAEAGIVNGILAPVAKVGGDFLVNKLAPASYKAFTTLAKTLDMSVQDLEKAYQTRGYLTGRTPSLAEITNDAQQGRLRALAQANPDVARIARIAEQQGQAPLHEQMAAADAFVTQPQSTTGLKNFRDVKMDRMMQTVPQGSNSGLTIGETPVQLTPEQQARLLNSPTVMRALGANMKGSDPEFSPSAAIPDKISSNSLSLRDVDNMRQALRRSQDSLFDNYGKLVGDSNTYNTLNGAASYVEKLGTDASDAYKSGMKLYRNDSNYADAFKHGLKGGSALDLPEGNGALAHAMTTEAGNNGFAHGNALFQGMQALKAIAPNTIPQEGTDAATIAHAVAAAKFGSPNHLIKFLQGVTGERMPPAAQAKVANMLFSKDPTVFYQGVANLKRFGVAQDVVNHITSGLGGITAPVAAQVTSPGPGQ